MKTTIRRAVVLTREDWEEIYYALDSKLAGIENGDYSPEEQPGDDAKWMAHLQAIMTTIGPDGMDALANGTEARS